MRLPGKSAVIYGANTPAGASVARAFAKEGGAVYLAGRSTGRLQPVAREIADAGGAVEVARVDPLDLSAVSEHLHHVVVQHGTVDISLNLAFQGMVGASRLCNLSDQEFASVAFTRVRSNFVTTAAAAKEMAYQGRGVILATGTPDGPSPDSAMAGQIIASAAVEALCRQLRLDVGAFGVQIAYLGDVPAAHDELAEELFRAMANVAPEAPGRPGAVAEAEVSDSPARTYAIARAVSS